MALPLPVNAPAELAEWVATLEGHFDENQRVRTLGFISHEDGTFTLRFLASAATGHVRVHQQISDTYGAADHEEDVDCREDRQQEVELDAVDGLYVWLIPLWNDQGTLRAFDGDEGPDHMALVSLAGALADLADVDIIAAADGDYLRHDGTSWKDVTIASILTDLLGVDGAGSGLDADLLDGEHGSFYRDASNLNAGELPDARLSSNIPRLDAALNTFTGDLTVEGVLKSLKDVVVYETGQRSSLNIDTEIDQSGSLKFRNVDVGGSNSRHRWEIMHFDTDEDGDDDGADLRFRAFDDAGVSIGFPLTLFRSDLSALFTGDVEIDKVDPVLLLDESGGDRGIQIEALETGGAGAHVLLGGPGPHGFEVYPSGIGGALESALYYRTTPQAWSFEDGAGAALLTIDIDDELISVESSQPEIRFIETGDDTYRILAGAGILRIQNISGDGEFLFRNADNSPAFRIDVPSGVVTSYHDMSVEGDIEIDGDIDIGGSLLSQWNILDDVMIKLRGATSNPGTDTEWGARIGFGAGLNPPYIAGIQLGADPDTAGLVFHCHPSATSSDPTVLAMQLEGFASGGRTAMWLLHNAGGSGQQFDQVQVGSADSGDVGFRVLQIPN